MYLGKATTQNPSIFILNTVKVMKQYNAIPHTEKPMYSPNSLTMILLEFGLQSKQNWSRFSLNSCSIPRGDNIGYKGRYPRE